MNIIVILMICIAIAAVVSAVLYVNQGKKSVQPKIDLEKVSIKDSGSTMDNLEPYAINPNKLGFW